MADAEHDGCVILADTCRLGRGVGVTRNAAYSVGPERAGRKDARRDDNFQREHVA